MTPWPAEPTRRALEPETVERLGGVTVATLPECTPATLSEASASLPLARWLG